MAPSVSSWGVGQGGARSSGRPKGPRPGACRAGMSVWGLTPSGSALRKRVAWRVAVWDPRRGRPAGSGEGRAASLPPALLPRTPQRQPEASCGWSSSFRMRVVMDKTGELQKAQHSDQRGLPTRRLRGRDRGVQPHACAAKRSVRDSEPASGPAPGPVGAASLPPGGSVGQVHGGSTAPGASGAASGPAGGCEQRRWAACRQAGHWSRASTLFHQPHGGAGGRGGHCGRSGGLSAHCEHRVRDEGRANTDGVGR